MFSIFPAPYISILAKLSDEIAAIGGADGPTAVFVSTDSGAVVTSVAVLILAAVLVLGRKSRK